MTTAQVLYEQYKVLPPRIRQELKELIDEGNAPVAEDDEENSDTIRISVKALKESIQDVKLLRAGKLKTRPAREVLNEIREELANEY